MRWPCRCVASVHSRGCYPRRRRRYLRTARRREPCDRRGRGRRRRRRGRGALIRRHSWKTSLWRLQRSTLAHRDRSRRAEDRLVPRRHGADRVEGFPCRSHTVARAHTRARITYVARSFFFLPLPTPRRRGDTEARWWSQGSRLVFEGVYLASVTLSWIICYFVLGAWIFNNCARNSIRASSLG